MKRILLAALGAFVLLVAVVLVRTVMFTAPETSGLEPVSYNPDRNALATQMSQAVQFQTISYDDTVTPNKAVFESFVAWLADTYPLAHQIMQREMVADHTILLKWEGVDGAAKPVLLTAHYDVVPVIPGTEELWTHPPFAGDVADGYVWGRGTIDDKGPLIAIMHAATLLLEQGFQPQQTVYLSFGHDEEKGGPLGAAGVAAHLKSQGVQLGWSLDEGSFILDGVIPGMDKPVAMINVAEKGYTTIDLVAHAVGGHSSMPPSESAVSKLAQAILKLHNAPLPGGLDGVTGDAYESIARHMPFVQRMAFANQWLFGGYITSQIAASPAGNAMLRTTTAPTMLSASIKENVMPITATATVNFRLHPRDTVESLLAHVRAAIDDDAIEIVLRRGSEASPVASKNSNGFKALAATTQDILGDVVTTPGLTVAGTDSKHYGQVADDAYRFNPMIVNSEDISGVHGTNERVSIDNLVLATDFYMQLLTNLNAQAPSN